MIYPGWVDGCWMEGPSLSWPPQRQSWFPPGFFQRQTHEDPPCPREIPISIPDAQRILSLCCLFHQFLDDKHLFTFYHEVPSLISLHPVIFLSLERSSKVHG